MKTKTIHSLQYLSLLILLMSFSSPTIVLAHEEEREAHVNFFIGLNVGAGGGALCYTEGDRSITEDPAKGAFGALRFGYAISEAFAISLESFGFGSEHEDEEWGIGASFASVTWHPGGNGFFLRAGVGGGGGHYTHPEDGERREIRDQLAGMFSIGYDWRVSDKIALGISLDSFSINADDSTGYDDDHLGNGSMSIQLNWFL